jgi:glucose dehydrogenase
MPPASAGFDKKFRAFDKSTGELLWETTLPFAGNATPATYEVGGRQFVVIAAFALPQESVDTTAEPQPKH